MHKINERTNELVNVFLSYKKVICALAFFSCITNILMLLPSLYMMQVYDRVLSSHSEMTLLMLTIITISLYFVMSFLDWIRSSILIKISAKLDFSLNERVFSASFEKSLKENNPNPSQAFSDLSSIRQFITGNGFFAFFDIPWLPIYLMVAFMFHPMLGFFTLAGISILVLLAIWNEYSIKKDLTEANHHSIVANGFMNSTLQNSEAIESMGMLANLSERWLVMQNKIIRLQASASDKNALISSFTKFIRISWQSLSLGVGALLVLENEISGGMMIACSILLGRTLAPVEQMIGVWKQLSNVRTSYNRLNKLLNDYPVRLVPMQLLEPLGRIDVENLSVTSPKSSNLILKNVTFNLLPGEVLGIIGPSASGKSTLIRALLGIWSKSDGTIRLDGAELDQWDKNKLGSHIGYLPQDIELFSGTIAENIARFNEVNSNAVIDAAKMAGIHEMILKLPDGYNTLIGSGGVGLSGGQRQRIGLARAIYLKPALVVLDEPNSNLDEHGEIALINAIRILKENKSTVLIITHKPNVLTIVDKVLLLIEGSLKIFGPRDRVLQAINNIRNKQ